ncbi:MAG: M48 family metalloprotease [Opitutae bacterium]|nr:M48 family metalloprotease [Opitutae bacterium]
MNKTYKFGFWILSGCLAILTGCYTVPETGRTAINFFGTSYEVTLGLSEFNKIKRQSPLSNDPVMVGRLQRVGWRISQVVGSDLPDAEWEFVLFDEPDTVNAFALPGGKVGVYSGIMEVAQTEDELATLVAHEIAHITARHGSERLSHGVLASMAGNFIQGALEGDRDQETYLAAYGLGTTYGIMLPFSRSHELEADRIGLIYAAKAGYDPRAALDFWMKMNLIKDREEVSAFFSTHPSDLERIDKLEALLPRALEIYEQNRIRYE